jgi:uncharacterized membrane-anchored protein
MFESGVSVSPFPGWIERPASWIKGHELPIIIGGIVFQLIILVGMIVMRLLPLLTGDVILLKVIPLDPRDMFRGDYVVLAYDCSRIPSGGVPGLKGSQEYGYRDVQGKTVYVTLVPDPDGKHWRPDKYSAERPKQGKYLRGQIQGWQIQFGIEAFYVQEGKGRDYENAVRNHKLSAEICVTPNGAAIVRNLLIE